VDDVQKNNLCGFGATCCEFLLERFPITWNHVIEKESLKFNDLEHIEIEKVERLFLGQALGRRGRSVAIRNAGCGFERRSFVAQAGLSIEHRRGKLEINQTFLRYA
jgi:hypothetical protein